MFTLLFPLLCGIAAAVLRGFQLQNSFEPVSGFIVSGDVFTPVLMIFSGAFIAVTLVRAALKKNSEPKPLGDFWFIIELLALAALLTASVFNLIDGFSQPRVSVICLGVLGIVSVFAIFVVANSVNRLTYSPAAGFWMTVPVFWSCFLLVVDFWNHAGNPVRNAFMYGMLAVVFCTLSLYAVAGRFFGKIKRNGAALYLQWGVFFAVLTAGGALTAHFILRADTLPDAAQLPVTTYLYMFFIAAHLSALSAALGKLTFEVEETPPEPAGESNEDI